jgi:tRNA(fMet)-specific endonuclease VapC
LNKKISRPFDGFLSQRDALDKSARPLENHNGVERFAARLEVLDFDAAPAHAGNIRPTLEREGRPIGGYDILIAGHARSRGLVVVTGNLRGFLRV